MRTNLVYLTAAALALSAIDGCGGNATFSPISASAPSTSAITISIVSPNPDSVVVGGTLQYGATITGTNDHTVDWSVQGSGTGSISSTGLYQSPGTAGTYTIVATADADKSVYATAPAVVTPAASSGSLNGTIQ